MVIIVKMTLQLLMLLLMKRIVRWRKKAKVILLATVTITVVIFGRTWNIIMGNVNTGDET
jgi:heme/copper-type cytochrome/quinol oxidase subunit 4